MGGYVIFYMYPPRFTKAGGDPRHPRGIARGDEGLARSCRSVVCGVKISRVMRIIRERCSRAARPPPVVVSLLRRRALDNSVGNYVLGRAEPARRPSRVREALVARPESCRARTSASRTTTPCSRAAPEAPGHLSLRGPASDARRDTVGPCWPCRAAAAAHRRDARPWRGGKQQQDFFFPFFVACCWPSGLCRSTHRSERGRREENKIGNTLSGMHERASPPRA